MSNTWDTSEAEDHLVSLLKDLQRRYAEEAKPIVDQLAWLRSVRAPQPMILTKTEAAKLAL